MVFNFDHTRVQIAWVMMNRQTCENLVKWFGALWTKLVSHMPHWKPLCFNVDDAPQELQTLG
jgi:hypothetical protein